MPCAILAYHASLPWPTCAVSYDLTDNSATDMMLPAAGGDDEDPEGGRAHRRGMTTYVSARLIYIYDMLNLPVAAWYCRCLPQRQSTEGAWQNRL